MMTTDYYSNRDIDGDIMTRLLKWGRGITTDQAKAHIEEYETYRSYAISNYKETRHIERELGDFRMLVSNRENWSQQGAFDDCTHWL